MYGYDCPALGTILHNDEARRVAVICDDESNFTQEKQLKWKFPPINPLKPKFFNDAFFLLPKLRNFECEDNR